MLFLIRSIRLGYSSSLFGRAHACSCVCLCLCVYVWTVKKEKKEEGDKNTRKKSRNTEKETNVGSVCCFWPRVSVEDMWSYKHCLISDTHLLMCLLWSSVQQRLLCCCFYVCFFFFNLYLAHFSRLIVNFWSFIMYSLHSSNDKDYDERCLEFFWQ